MMGHKETMKHRVSLIVLMVSLAGWLNGCGLTSPVSEMKMYDQGNTYPDPAVVRAIRASKPLGYLRNDDMIRNHVLSVSYTPNYSVISSYLDEQFMSPSEDSYGIHHNVENLQLSTNLLYHDWETGAINIQVGLGSGLNLTQKIWRKTYLTANGGFMEGELILQRRLFSLDSPANASVGVFARTDRYRVIEEDTKLQFFQLLLLYWGSDYLQDYPKQYQYVHQAGIRSSFHVKKSIHGFVSIGKGIGISQPILNVGISLRNKR
ncbi:MAG: hypothetical protein ACQETE_06500 [Bacteroidota bacterium]